MSNPTNRSSAALSATAQGRYFEDFKVGDVYRHPLGRTDIVVDHSLLPQLTQNMAGFHLDAHRAATTEWERPLVDSTFTLALVIAQSAQDVSMNVMVNLGWDRVRLPTPAFAGDTIYSQSEVLAVGPAKSRSDVGAVSIRTVGFNQNGVTVITFERSLLVFRRDHAPRMRPVEPPWEAQALTAAPLPIFAQTESHR